MPCASAQGIFAASAKPAEAHPTTPGNVWQPNIHHNKIGGKGLNFSGGFLPARSFFDDHLRKMSPEKLFERITIETIVINDQCLEHLDHPANTISF